MGLDRASISKQNRDLLKKMGDDNVLGFELAANKDIFLFLTALGLDDPKEIQGGKDGYFLLKDLKASDRTLISVALLGNAKNNEDVDRLSDFDEAVKFCEKCAETGLDRLKEKLEDADFDLDVLERRMLSEVDHMYMQMVENDI